MASLKDSVVPEFKNMKFRVKDEEHSKQIQEHLFSLGYRWIGNRNAVVYTDSSFLFLLFFIKIYSNQPSSIALFSALIRYLACSSELIFKLRIFSRSSILTSPSI